MLEMRGEEVRFEDISAVEAARIYVLAEITIENNRQSHLRDYFRLILHLPT
jgi:hypothetical protein